MRKSVLVLIILLGISLFFNVLFVVSDVLFEMKAKAMIKKDFTVSEVLKSKEEFRAQLMSTLKDHVVSGRRVEFPSTKMFISERLTSEIAPPKKYPLLYWSEPSWSFVALLEDAMIHGDRESIEDLANVFEGVLNTSFEVVDQSTMGIGAIYLDSLKTDSKYKAYADNLFYWLKDRDGDYGILYGNDKSRSIVDALGMVVPFLMKYAQAYHCVEAEKLAYKTIEKYIEYGCDDSTGIPAFTYRTNPPRIKMGMTNWGRGISWFCLGLFSIDESKLTTGALKKVTAFNSSLYELWKQDRSFSQFVGENNKKDLSAELPILYYLYKKQKIELSRNDVLQYSQFMHNGEMYNSSSSNTGIVRYGVSYGPNMLSDAFMLKLINEVE
jgi:hypothetical protein